MSRALQKSKIKLGLYLIIPLVLFLLPLSLIEAAPSVCLFKNILGLECPGCGITRAVVSVLQGDLAKAWEYNKLVVVVLPLLGYVYLRGLIRRIGSPETKDEKVLSSPLSGGNMRSLSKIGILLLGTFLLAFLFCQVVVAQKRPIPRANTLTYKGIRYIASRPNIGWVEAWDLNTGKRIWEKEVYKITYDPKQKVDDQQVYITRLYVENNKLKVKNEKDEKYELELVKTQEDSYIPRRKVDDLIYNGIRFTFPPERIEYVTTDECKQEGFCVKLCFVEAWDIKEGKKFWQKKLYGDHVYISIEQDVRRMFITKLRIEKGDLIIELETGGILRTDLKEIEETRQDFLYYITIGKEKKAEFQKRINEFFEDGFVGGLGSKEEEVIKKLGPPKKIKREYPNYNKPLEHNYESIDLFYDGLHINIYKDPYSLREFVSIPDGLTSDKYKMKWELNIGCSKKHVLDTLGRPSWPNRTKDSLTYYAEGNNLHFYFKEDKLIKIEWEYYID